MYCRWRRQHYRQSLVYTGNFNRVGIARTAPFSSESHNSLLISLDNGGDIHEHVVCRSANCCKVCTSNLKLHEGALKNLRTTFYSRGVHWLMRGTVWEQGGGIRWEGRGDDDSPKLTTGVAEHEAVGDEERENEDQV